MHCSARCHSSYDRMHNSGTRSFHWNGSTAVMLMLASLESSPDVRLTADWPPVYCANHLGLWHAQVKVIQREPSSRMDIAGAHLTGHRPSFSSGIAQGTALTIEQHRSMHRSHGSVLSRDSEWHNEGCNRSLWTCSMQEGGRVNGSTESSDS